MLLKLRPLIVVTGTLHVEGGLKSQRRASAPGDKRMRGGTRTTVVQDREISAERKAAHVIFATYARRIKGLRIMKTPFGMLVAPDKLREVQALLVELTKRAAVFNKDSKVCKIENCLVWEELAGNRKAALEGWLARRKMEADDEVIEALPELQAA